MDFASYCHRLWATCLRRPIPVAIFASLGAIWSLDKLLQLSSFVYLHALHQSRLDQYRLAKRKVSWALVTGASDGIGKGFAEELLHRGFNVILHGRNRTKLENVKIEMEKRHPDREIRIMVCDASQASQDLRLLRVAIDETLRDLHIKILVNNVGGGTKPLWTRLQDHTDESARSFLDIDCRFTTDLTRLLLPKLISAKGALIINIGSFVSDLAAPYISILGGAKAYGRAWSRSLALETKIEGSNVEVLHVQVGMVSTPNDPRPVSWLVPSARQMASQTLDKVGCGRSEVFGYWPHELHSHLLTGMPQFIQEPMLMRIVKELKEKEKLELLHD